MPSTPAQWVKGTVDPRNRARDAYADEINASKVALLESILKLFNRRLVKVWVRGGQQASALCQQHEPERSDESKTKFTPTYTLAANWD